MAQTRFKALETIDSRKAKKIKITPGKISDIFAKDVFTDSKMSDHVSGEVFKSVQKSIAICKVVKRVGNNQISILNEATEGAGESGAKKYRG